MNFCNRKSLKISSNIFDDLHQLHGPEFFSRSDRINRIKNSMYRYIKASGDYKKVVKTVIGDCQQVYEKTGNGMLKKWIAFTKTGLILPLSCGLVQVFPTVLHNIL